MRYRTLGSTGIQISEIGFGAWGIGGVSRGATSYGPTDDHESRRALRRAYDLGITLYDTSDIYGYGHSESLIGEELSGHRGQIVIATKVGMREHRGPFDLSRAYVRHALEQSLKRLKTSYVDLYQIHSPPFDMLAREENLMETFRELKREGKIRAIGISTRSPEEGIRAIREYGFDALQVNFNMIDQRALDSGLMELAQEQGVGIIARTPLCYGFLSGKLQAREFGSLDHRSTWHPRQQEAWMQAPKLFAPLNHGTPRTMTQLALQFCLAYPKITSAIPGILHPREAEENAATSDIPPLTPEECSAIRSIYETNTFFYKDLEA